MKKTLSHIAVALLVALPMIVRAQFDEKTTLIGPHIGLAAFGSAPVFGANFETAITKPGTVGPGLLGISVRADYFTFGYATDYSYTWIAVGGFCNYHFNFDDKKWDLFVGAGLGYQNVSVKYNGAGSDPLSTYAWGSGIYFAGNAGARYFLSQGLALRALVGFGISYLAVGVDFRI